jgi:hypothetical protein
MTKVIAEAAVAPNEVRERELAARLRPSNGSAMRSLG